MKIFLDSAGINEIKTYIASGFVDGVTTNPSLIAKSGCNILEAIPKICELVDSPVSADVATLPPEILGSLYKHPLTDKGLAAFISDWEGSGPSIL